MCVCVYIYMNVIYQIPHQLLYQILFLCRLLQNTDYSSLCYRVGPGWLSVLYTAVCECYPQVPNLSLPFHLSPLITIGLFSVSVSLLLSYKEEGNNAICSNMDGLKDCHTE